MKLKCTISVVPGGDKKCNRFEDKTAGRGKKKAQIEIQAVLKSNILLKPIT